jgi:hypothetical protein
MVSTRYLRRRSLRRLREELEDVRIGLAICGGSAIYLAIAGAETRPLAGAALAVVGAVLLAMAHGLKHAREWARISAAALLIAVPLLVVVETVLDARSTWSDRLDLWIWLYPCFAFYLLSPSTAERFERARETLAKERAIAEAERRERELAAARRRGDSPGREG